MGDIASFGREVKYLRILEAVPYHMRIITVSPDMVQVVVSAKHWLRVSRRTLMDEPMHEMAFMLNKIERMLLAKDEQAGQGTVEREDIAPQMRSRKYHPTLPPEDILSVSAAVDDLPGISGLRMTAG